MTKDLDVFVEPTPENALSLFKALAEFGAPLAGFTPDDFCDGHTITRFGNPPICFDILQMIDGVDFAAVYRNSLEVTIDGDLQVRYISADDLIRNKLASGRPQDLADVEAIRNAKRFLGTL